jgi:3-oxoacyl-[acyl-carrier-protein] synthase II
MDRRRVVITGVGAITPMGVGADVLYERWHAGEVGIANGEGRCDAFRPEDFLSTKEIRRSDRFTQLALAAAAEAVAQAGWDEAPLPDAGRIACIVSSGIGGIETISDRLDKWRAEGLRTAWPLTIPVTVPNAVVSQLTIKFGLRGESYCVVSACAGGSQAIGAGLRTILAGEADAAMVGGSEAAMLDFATAGFKLAGALSESGRSLPFDRNRDGFVMGEGAGIMILEEAETAERRGAEVLGELCGYGSSTDAFHITAPAPGGEAAAIAVRLALERSEITPAQLAYINAHGTATSLNDTTETQAFELSLGDAVGDIPVSSTKSVIGHLLGAAGAVEAVATLAALRARSAPPTVGLRDVDDEVASLRHIQDVPMAIGRDGERVYGLSTSFGFGGHNAAVVLSGPPV